MYRLLMDDKDRIIAELRALVESLTAEIKSLKLELAKAKKDSSTSSSHPRRIPTDARKPNVAANRDTNANCASRFRRTVSTNRSFMKLTMQKPVIVASLRPTISRSFNLSNDSSYRCMSLSTNCVNTSIAMATRSCQMFRNLEARFWVRGCWR